MVSPYYYGQHKWANYIQDIQHNQEKSVELHERNSRLHKDAIGVAQDQLDELRQQTHELHEINETFQLGFEELRAEFNWGFTLMVERLDRQIDVLSEVAGRLDAIHKTLQSPLMTQARELFLIGQDRYKKGLLDKALEAYLSAEQKNDVDFPLQFQIGTLFLYGTNDDSKSVDVAKAEKHLSDAARFAEADKDSIPDWSVYCGKAHFHAAVAAYLVGEQEQKAGAVDAMRQSLERALTHLAKAVSLWPKFIESIYLRAKCHALLGQGKQALGELNLLFDRDRRYYSKSTIDGDFRSIRSEVEEVFTKSIVEPGSLARATEQNLKIASESLAWAKRSNPQDTDDLVEITSLGNSLVESQTAIRATEADIEGLHSMAIRAIRDLDEIATRMFDGRVKSIEAQIRAAEAKKTNCHKAISELNEQINRTKGTDKIGCQLSFLFFWGSIFILNFVLRLFSAINLFYQYRTIFTVVIVMVTSSGVFIGRSLSRRRLIKPLWQRIEEHSHAAKECDALIERLLPEESKAIAEYEPFLEWRRRINLEKLKETPT